MDEGTREQIRQNALAEIDVKIEQTQLQLVLLKASREALDPSSKASAPPSSPREDGS